MNREDLLRASLGQPPTPVDVSAFRVRGTDEMQAIREWRGWYATGEAPSPSEWQEFDRRFAALEAALRAAGVVGQEGESHGRDR